MFLPDLCIRRPVFTVMIVSAIGVFGAIAYFMLGVDQYPKIDYPYVVVQTKLRGASPDVMELDVTDPLEEEINTIQGIRNLTSKSSEGFSEITVEFRLDRDIDVAAQDVRDKVAIALEKLPKDVEHPIVDKLDPSASPIMWIAVQGNMPIKEISDYAHYVLKPKFQVLPGVGLIIEGASRRKAMRIWLDPNRLKARQITVEDVIDALRRKHSEVPGGKIERGSVELYIRTLGEFKDAEDFNNLIIDYRSGAPIKLKDVGFAEFGMEDRSMVGRYRYAPGAIEPAVGLGVKKQSGANTVAVSREVMRVFKEARKHMPEGMSMNIAVNRGDFIVASINDVQYAILFAILITGLVVLFFLRNPVGTFIVFLAIPVSFLGTFTVMYFLGFTLNNMTLLALSLAVGVVIDDAIVVLESIFRHKEKGLERFEAASRGAGLVAFAVISTTIVMAAMFIPVAFLGGIVGRFLYEFGITVSVAVFVSTFVALTLTPMLCSRWLKVGGKRNKVFVFFERMFLALERVYVKALGWSLRWRFIICIIAAASLTVGIFFAGLVGRELVPSSDTGQFMVSVKTPVGSSLDYTDSMMKKIGYVLDETPEVKSFFSAGGFGGGNKGIFFVHLVPKYDRTRSQGEIIAGLRRQFAGVPGVFAFPLEFERSFGAGRGAALEFSVSGPELTELEKLDVEFQERLSKIPGIVDVDSDLELGRPMVYVNIDREKAADLGVDVTGIGNAIRAMMGGVEVVEAKYKHAGKRYNTIVRLAEQYRDLPQHIGELHLRNKEGRIVGLKDLVSIEEATGFNVINRRNRQRSFVISANLVKDEKTLGEAVKDVNEIAKEILPEQYIMAFSGKAETFKESLRTIIFVLVLSMVITYMVLASLFDSFIHPLTVMVALPLSFAGGFGLLLVTGNTINAYSVIGLILLFGLVSKNSILLVDYTNRLRRAGKDVREAILEAAETRMRPILMTAFSTMFGMLPIAIGLGYGAEARAGMGVVAAGGMFSSMCLTLLVVPVFYSLLDELVQITRRSKRKKPKKLKKAAAAASTAKE
ncbi:MAG: efflux RND transporter permease subunit [Candidatus Brocadiales bacterium]|nr:efflux RND transporter permease subunit [Candidatus Bathyanammoxibius amoris]